MLRMNSKGILVPTVKGCLSIAISMARHSDGINPEEVYTYFKKELDQNGYKIVSKEKLDKIMKLP